MRPPAVATHMLSHPFYDLQACPWWYRVTAAATYPRLPADELARQTRDMVKDKSYRAFPLGGEAGHYLRWKRGRLTDSSYCSYEACLDKLARHFTDLELKDFEPPVGTERIEEFLEHLWGDQTPRTYNKNLSYLKDFFKWAQLKDKLRGDPTLAVQRRKARDVHREIFNPDVRAAILADGPAVEHLFRDRCALRLLLTYGLRKGALRAVQFKHFDHHRKLLTIFTKGEVIRNVQIPDPGFWDDLGRHIVDWGAHGDDYLLPRQKTVNRGYSWAQYRVKEGGGPMSKPLPMGDHGAHSWWYGCLHRAGVVGEKVERGERMHKARHTAGQRILDKTKGNVKAAQKLLGHKSGQTTIDTYVDWDDYQLAATLEEIDDGDA